jgi:uncharacterized Zn finger protein
MGYGYRWGRYISVEERRKKSAAKVASMKKAGKKVNPIEVSGRKMTRTFWGQAWCKHLESYSDLANRLPRGRAYVRNGSVIDLQIKPYEVKALVSGSQVYKVQIKIDELCLNRWKSIKNLCAGEITSLVDLLKGSLSESVMKVVTQPDKGLFPHPDEIHLSCSCPDWAVMCKHVVAVLYGVGVRFDEDAHLLFQLRGVDPNELLDVTFSEPKVATEQWSSSQLEDVFGVDFGSNAIDPKDQVLENEIQSIGKQQSIVVAGQNCFNGPKEVLKAYLKKIEKQVLKK